jgi:two-component system, chemotaxis family, protein-glutamate methylesterase/glutaminase
MPDDAPHGSASPLRRDIVVIGASAGGVQVLLDLAAQLPEQFPAPILVVLHVGAHRSVLPELMNARDGNRALHPADGAALQPGMIYVAPPDQHMLVDEHRIRLYHGPKENHARPAIDPLFRTAALAHGPRVIGVVLSGRLDDGTAGLQAIKHCGGLAVIQDPVDAEHPDMPASALAHVRIDRCIAASQLAPTLEALVGTPVAPDVPASVSEDPAREHLLREQAVSAGAGDPMEHLNAIGHRSRFSCPECAGVLWEIDGSRPRRYRCHTGHSFTLRSLAYTQDQRTDDALWSAMRALQEREALQRSLADAAERDNGGRAGEALATAAGRTHEHARQLRRMIQSD